MYEDLLDPTGGYGERIADDPELYRVDLGFGLGAPVAHWLTRKFLIPWKSSGKVGLFHFYSKTPNLAGIPYSGSATSLSGLRFSMANRELFQVRRTLLRGLRKLERVGWWAGILTLADIGMSLGEKLFEPGVRRDGIQHDLVQARNEQFIDTQMAYTQRRRALEAIHNNQLSLNRAILGQESRWLHK